MASYFPKTNNLTIDNETLKFSLPREHILTGKITISQKLVHDAEMKGATLVKVKSGTDEFIMSIERIKHESQKYDGFYFTSLSRWKTIEGKKSHNRNSNQFHGNKDKRRYPATKGVRRR